MIGPDELARHPLAWVHREAPNVIPKAREVLPAFYGCFDWHSAVHGHWTLARIARLHPTCISASAARAALEQSLTSAHVEVECRYFERQPTFERPYGLAWALTLAQELREWGDGDARRWAETLEPLEQLAATRLGSYFAALPFPVRSGEHTQTAFAMGLAIDWARSTRDAERERVYVDRARAFHERDHDAPFHREPSGADFLSPSLAEADVMRRVFPPPAFARWLDGFLPAEVRLSPVVSPDRSDGRLSHLEGLNLSRAWMLEGIAGGLPVDDPRRAPLLSLASDHAAAGLAALESEHDSLTHWIATFAAYLVTRRGLGV